MEEEKGVLGEGRTQRGEGQAHTAYMKIICLKGASEANFQKQSSSYRWCALSPPSPTATRCQDLKEYFHHGSLYSFFLCHVIEAECSCPKLLKACLNSDSEVFGGLSGDWRTPTVCGGALLHPVALSVVNFTQTGSTYLQWGQRCENPPGCCCAGLLRFSQKFEHVYT